MAHILYYVRNSALANALVLFNLRKLLNYITRFKVRGCDYGVMNPILNFTTLLFCYDYDGKDKIDLIFNNYSN